MVAIRKLKKRKQRLKLGSIKNSRSIRVAFESLNRRLMQKRIANPILADAHGHSYRNSNEIKASKVCGCFFCLKVFPSELVKTWWDIPDGNANSDVTLQATAVCPFCVIDSVLGDLCGSPVNEEFLKKMHAIWFDDSSTIYQI